MKVLRSKDIKLYRDKHNKGYCPLTLVPLNKQNKAVLDHDHDTGVIRQVLWHGANQFEGKIVSAYKRYVKWNKSHKMDLPAMLRGLADYLEEDYSQNPVHPKYINILVSRFSRFNITQQSNILLSHGIPLKDQGNTKDLKIKQFRKVLMAPNNIYKV